MCTVSWLRDPEGLELFFNRDERRTRKSASPAAIRRAEGTRFIAPLDGDFGGSWLAASEHGLVVGLLNGYAAGDDGAAEPPGGFTSRGRLPLSLIGSRSAEQIERRLSSLDLTRFRSFVMLALAPDGGSLRADWRGEKLEMEHDLDPTTPLISSSFDTAAVCRRRAGLFAELLAEHGPGAATHLRFHASHRPRKGPYSPCMHRPEARTVSFSRIRVDRDRVSFDYAPHPPCEGLPDGPSPTLDRAAFTGR